jgi:hypothetical protein
VRGPVLPCAPALVPLLPVRPKPPQPQAYRRGEDLGWEWTEFAKVDDPLSVRQAEGAIAE